jgi:UDP-N-acetylmuramate--alanine ligase
MISSKKSSRAGVHFIGIGGIGMSGLARYSLALSKNPANKEVKWVVSGSDAARSVMTQELIKDGINVKIGHKKGNIPRNARLVIYNRAIPPENPELQAAEADKRIVTLPYSKALGRITEQYQTIAITGSHGKSTTTALTGLALLRAGLDPTILVGTKLKDLHGRNIRVGHGPYLVLEADDYRAAFLDYSPVVSIVTNIDREHMDFYKTAANVKRAFMKFLGKTREGGALILNRDDAPLRSLKPQIVQLAKKKHLRVVWFSVRGDAAKAMRIRRVIPIPGPHNVSNALAVAKLGEILKIPEKKILAAIGSYQGAWRRMEFKGNVKIKISHRGINRMLAGKIPIYDDYAHHPSEIKATLAAFREKFPQSPIVCVFQPHQAKRLELLFNEFMKAFDEADIVFILPLYHVLGRDEKLPRDSVALVRAIERRSSAKPIFYVREPKKIKFAVETAIRDVPLVRDRRFTKPAVVIMMGAGDIADLTEKLLK